MVSDSSSPYKNITEIQEQEEQLRALLEFSPEAILIHQDGKVVYANPSAIHIFGGNSSADLVGKKIFDLIDKQYQVLAKERIARAQTSGQAQPYVLEKYLRLDGAPIFVEVATMPLPYKGKPAIQIILHNVTKREELERSLRESEQKYRVLAESAHDFIFVVNEKGQISYVNEFSLKILQLSRAEVMGKNVQDIFPKNIADHYLINVKKTLQDNTSQYFEEESFFAGKEVWLGTWLSPLTEEEFNERHSIRSVLGISRDITAQKKSVEALLISESKTKDLNRALRTISAVNQLLVRAKSEQELLDGTCAIIVEMGKYILSWVGYLDPQNKQIIVPMARAGKEDGYIEETKINLADPQRGHGPTGEAIHTKTAVTCQNILTDPRFLPWREHAIKIGFSSSIALPLTINNEVVGALNIYSANTDAFDEEETHLLAELANDLSFGLTTLRLHEKLYKSEEHYRILFHTSPIGLFQYNNNLVITDFNDSLVKILQSAAERLKGLPLTKLKDQNILPALRKALEGEEGFYEGRYQATTGPAEIYAVLHTAPIFNAQHQVVGAMATVEDVTQKVKAENLLRESEARYRGLIEASPDSVTLTDLEGKITFTNNFGAQLYGFSSPDAMIGKNAFDFIVPKDRQRSIENAQYVLREGQIRNVEYGAIRKDGSEFEVEINVTLLRDGRGNPEAFLGITRDISERKKTLQILQAQNEQLQRLNKVMVGRELKMIELKKEIAATKKLPTDYSDIQ